MARPGRSGKSRKKKQSSVLNRIIGSSPALKRMLARARAIAKFPVSVLLNGPTGSGKESLARYIHEVSGRRGNFVAVNCATLNPELALAELFGYERGAFTGAQETTPGLFEAAQGGTLFLDEVAELAAGVQNKLLRVLQEKQVRRLGGKKEIPVDVRVIAATHRSLPVLEQADQFRSDLIYRLREYEIVLPPLRERGADTLAIARHILKTDPVCRVRKMRLGKEAAALLASYDWPGNVRQLQTVLRHAVTDGTGRRLEASMVAALLGLETSGPSVQDLRAELLNHIGVGSSTTQELITATRTSRWRVSREISALVGAGILLMEGAGRTTCYRRAALLTVNGASAPEPPASAEQVILERLTAEGALRRGDLESLGISPRTVARLLAKLIGRGLIEQVGGGRYVRYRLKNSDKAK